VAVIAQLGTVRLGLIHFHVGCCTRRPNVWL